VLQAGKPTGQKSVHPALRRRCGWARPKSANHGWFCSEKCTLVYWIVAMTAPITRAGGPAWAPPQLLGMQQKKIFPEREKTIALGLARARPTNGSDRGFARSNLDR